MLIPYRIIIVNDGSADNTPDIAKKSTVVDLDDQGFRANRINQF